MLRVYFDDELIDVEAYTELDNEYKLFTETFKLGSVASNTFKLSVLKTAVNSQPYNVRIEDDDTVMHFVVDNVTEDDYVYAYTLTDKLLNFNFNYDASGIISLKEQEEEECYLSDIWKDMCNQANVEYDEDYIFENDIVVNWYDNRVQARRYLSYIAELQSGYACILENGKQSFKKQKRSSVKTIDADECSDLIIGEKKKITRVVYDSGAFKWEYGDFEGNTLYLQSDNVFIVNETIVENIYNNIKDFEFYILDVPKAPMDSSIKAGDVITINDNGVMYPTIAQYTMSYAGGWTGGYKIAVNTDRQQETQVIKDKDSIRNLSVKVDRLNNEFSIVAEEVGENKSQITQMAQTVAGFTGTIEEIDEIKDRTTIIEGNIEGLNVGLSSIGGTNLIKNSVGHYQGDWDNLHTGFTNTEIKNNTVSKNCFFVGNKSSKQIIQTQNGTYTISYKYKKLLELAEVKIVINNHEIELTDLSWKSGSYTFEVLSNTITVEIIGNNNNSCYLSDLMGNQGIVPHVWSSASGESINGGVKIGSSIEIESSVSNVKQIMDNDGNRIKNIATEETVAEFTDKGIVAKEIKTEKAEIARIVIQNVGNQTWISRI